MAANLTLVAWITRRITGSASAGAFAAMLWTANAALVTVMAWSSAYNEALCSLFLLSALALFIRYAETGAAAFWWWQLVVFTLGFGALEINVVYPALAAAYVLFVAPARKTPEAAARPDAAFLHFRRVFPRASRCGRRFRATAPTRSTSTAGCSRRWRLLEMVACPRDVESAGHSALVRTRDLLDRDHRALAAFWRETTDAAAVTWSFFLRPGF